MSISEGPSRPRGAEGVEDGGLYPDLGALELYLNRLAVERRVLAEAIRLRRRKTKGMHRDVEV